MSPLLSDLVWQNIMSWNATIARRPPHRPRGRGRSVHQGRGRWDRCCSQAPPSPATTSITPNKTISRTTSSGNIKNQQISTPPPVKAQFINSTLGYSINGNTSRPTTSPTFFTPPPSSQTTSPSSEPKSGVFDLKSTRAAFEQKIQESKKVEKTPEIRTRKQANIQQWSSRRLIYVLIE